MAKRIILNTAFKSEPIIWGISANEKAYHLSWIINTLFDRKLALSPPLQQTKNSTIFEFETFVEIVDNVLCTRLVSNQSAHLFLHKNYKNLDFFLFFFCSENIPVNLAKKLRQEKGIIAIFELDIDPPLKKILKQF